MKYGSVYTPKDLAAFTAELLMNELSISSGDKSLSVLDPACGEYALIEAAWKLLGDNATYYGIDVDQEAVALSKSRQASLGFAGEVLHADFIAPNTKKHSEEYWTDKFGEIDAIIANPPWSSNRIYDKQRLAALGYHLIDGQYDSYYLFTELTLRLLKEGGVAALILPDSLFSETAAHLRHYLLDSSEIKVIARLGEKLFPNVHRATTVLVVKKNSRPSKAMTSCFRLSTDARRLVLSGDSYLMKEYDKGKHLVPQSRFYANTDFRFDIDVQHSDRTIIGKIDKSGGQWFKHLKFSRGVEISKKGTVTQCPHCEKIEPLSRGDNLSRRVCRHCGLEYEIKEGALIKAVLEAPQDGYVPMLVGENINRYMIRGSRYIKQKLPGIKFKDPSLYLSPKLLIRKTGMGIKSVVETKGQLVSQTVYFFIHQSSASENLHELYYYAALLNSRVMYYSYLKRYGENEWKSHPYLTKSIIEEMPLICFEDSGDYGHRIALLSETLHHNYDDKVDDELEVLICELYGLNTADRFHIGEELAKLPNLEAIRELKRWNV